MAWRPANSLVVLHRQLKEGSRAAPPATAASSWGTIGDAEHDPTSDHTPHDFPGWGNDIVTAADFPNAPALGLDAHKVLDDIRRSRDSRVKYAISNDQIFSSYATSKRAAWTWGPYNPGDPNRDRHYDHGHLSVVGDPRADSTAPWHTIGADMPLEPSDVDAIWNEGVDQAPANGWDKPPAEFAAAAATGAVPARLRLVEAARRAYLAYAGTVAILRQSKANGESLSELAAKVDALAAPAPVEMTDEQLEVLADKVADRLGALRFVADAPTDT